MYVDKITGRTEMVAAMVAKNIMYMTLILTGLMDAGIKRDSEAQPEPQTSDEAVYRFTQNIILCRLKLVFSSARN